MSYEKIYFFTTGAKDRINFTDIEKRIQVQHPSAGDPSTVVPFITDIPNRRFIELTKYGQLNTILISAVFNEALEKDWIRAFNEFGVEIDIGSIPPAVGDMRKVDYDSDGDGKVNAADQADVADEISGTPPANRYYGTDGTGTKGFFAFPSLGGDMLSTNNLGDVANALTSFNNIKQQATTTYTGVIELATQTEVNTGTDAQRAVTPATLANSTLATNVATNNSKVSNATHTGEVTGATALTLHPTAISNKATVVPTSGDFILILDATDGALKKIDANTVLSPTIPDASETVKGITEIATQVEVDAGTDDFRYITPLKLANSALASAVSANTAKTSNATHTGEVTGATTLAVHPTAISNKAVVTPVSGDYILLWDATDSLLKRVNASNFLGGGGGNNLSYQGTWDANANSTTPGAASLASGVGTENHYYIVDTAGATNLDGITDWQPLDWVVYNGTAWTKIDNTDLVTSVDGQTGAVSIATASTTVQGKIEIATQAEVDAGTDAVRAVTPATLANSTLASDVSTNNAKVSNATHTGEVTGATALALHPTAISNKTTITGVAGDFLLILDATDGLLKKIDFSTISGTGDLLSANNLSDVASALTSFNNIKQNATEIFTGVTEIATQAEVDTGTDDFRYITPLKLANSTLASNVTTNNAKVSNATHTGEVTGSTALTMNVNGTAITNRTSKATPVGADQVLIADSEDTNQLKRATLTSVVALAGGGGETNTAISLGGGFDVYKTKDGVQFQFRSLTATKDATWTTVGTPPNDNELNLNVPYRHLSVAATESGDDDKYDVSTGESPVLAEGDLAGMLFTVTFNNANTTAGPQLNVDVIGDKDIYVNGGAPAIGDLQPGVRYLLNYDGTRFQVINVVPNFGTSTVTGGMACFAIDINNTSTLEGTLSAIRIRRCNYFKS
jgi:hypothetical protein